MHTFFRARCIPHTVLEFCHKERTLVPKAYLCATQRLGLGELTGNCRQGLTRSEPAGAAVQGASKAMTW